MAFDTLVAAYSLHPPNYGLRISTIFTFALRYIEYIYSFALVRQEGKSPFPLWMHTFYLAHDIRWWIRLYNSAAAHNWNWFLVAEMLALSLWKFFEAFNIYMAIMIERNEIWGTKSGKLGGRVSIGIGGPLMDVIKQVIGFFCVVSLFIAYAGEDCIYESFLFTNIIMAWGPGTLWRKRKDRRGCSVGLAVVIVIATINSFAPWSMWVLALPEIFQGFWFKASGWVFTGIALGNLWTVLDLKAKKLEKWEKADKPLIW